MSVFLATLHMLVMEKISTDADKLMMLLMTSLVNVACCLRIILLVLLLVSLFVCLFVC